jgi:hypothetical protein
VAGRGKSTGEKDVFLMKLKEITKVNFDMWKKEILYMK